MKDEHWAYEVKMQQWEKVCQKVKVVITGSLKTKCRGKGKAKAKAIKAEIEIQSSQNSSAQKC